MYPTHSQLRALVVCANTSMAVYLLTGSTSQRALCLSRLDDASIQEWGPKPFAKCGMHFFHLEQLRRMHVYLAVADRYAVAILKSETGLQKFHPPSQSYSTIFGDRSESCDLFK